MTSDRSHLNWKVPTSEWDAFLEYVREKYGGISGHAGREVESAMREWIDEDDYSEIESQIRRLVEAAGRTPEATSEKKRERTITWDSDRTMVGARVDQQLKDDFKAFAKEHTDDYLGIALARALHERREGGRSGRIKRDLERVIDDAEGLLSELDDSADPEAGLSLREKRTITICNRLPELDLDRNLHIDDIHEVIGEVAGDSKPTIRDYEQLVIDRLDAVQHPNNPQLYISRGRAEKLAAMNGSSGPDAPAIDRKDYSALPREEKIEGIQIELARRSLKRDGKYQFNAGTISQELFDDIPSPGHVNDLMKAASDPDGYHIAKSYGKQALRIDLQDVSLQAVKDALDTDDENESEENQEDEPDSQNELRAEATEEMDTLMSSKPEALTDGGTPE